MQLAMPAQQEERARAFYGELLGFTEVPKPADLAGRGGAWFRSGPLHLHLGVDPAFAPSGKAHVAFRCVDFDDLVARLERAGVAVTRAGAFEDGAEHAYIDDPFGNRLELVANIARPGFGGFDHIDARVGSLEVARRMYDPLMAALGLTGIYEWNRAVEYYEPEGPDRLRRFFGIHVSPGLAPQRSRIAFTATSRALVDGIVALLPAAGARDIEPPDGELGPDYYAVFFSDPDGNPLEVCHRSGSAVLPAE